MIREPPAVDPRTVGLRLQEARKARALTQRDVAEQLSARPSSRWSTGPLSQGGQVVHRGTALGVPPLLVREHVCLTYTDHLAPIC